MVILFLLMILPLVYGERIIVTNNGPLRGISVADGNVYAFLGVPYAEPPVGRLRFAKPVPKSSWTETYDADKLPLTCVQAQQFSEFLDLLEGEHEMSEDCLYLNLWVPKSTNVPKPIMLFIHGGAFMLGTSSTKIYDGAKLSQRGDVIVVTINYRVGTLGFFSGFTDEAPGSMGMYDQVMAIQWIKDNAKHFGGDPDNIVLFGESAGSFSVSLHLVSPLSRNLFNRGILESGTVVHPMYSDNNKGLLKDCKYIAKKLGCADDDDDLERKSQKVIECMKNLPPEKFSEVDKVYFNKYGFLIPRVGDEFLPGDPTTLFREGKNEKSEVIIGVTRDEGPMLLFGLHSDIFGTFGQNVNPSTFDETSAKKIFKSVTKVDESFFQIYEDRVKADSKYTYLKALCDAYGDFLITCGSVFQADYQSINKNSVYFYVFDQKISSSPFPEWTGVLHAEELPFVFGNPLFGNLTDYEKELSNDMMDMWAAFAKKGNPNVSGGIKWPQYTYDDPKYLIIGQEKSVGVGPFKKRCEAWRKVFQAVVHDEL